ncbi:hypothetical protein [Cerasicoccus frondis]|uniref:hypothetical protein n=1 Tax=Cerasicoccus frondis TaxID=490090 RepID=UPI0028525F23|nr:hypothetical protein [Cerasicoccus frondis]
MVWFITSPLKPYDSATYNLEQASGNIAKPDLLINESGASVEISTKELSAKFPLGQGSDSPPPPLLGLRFKEGTLSKTSIWSNPGPIQSWQSQVIASGSVFAKVRTSYQFQDGSYASFTATIIAGDNTVYWRMAVSGNYPETKVIFNLPAIQGAPTVIQPKGYGQWARSDKKINVASLQNNQIQLSPKTSLLALFPQNPWRLDFDNGKEQLALFSRMPGDWVKPVAMQTYYGQEDWSLPMIEKMWAGWQASGMPVNYATDGGIELTAPCSTGVREWAVANGQPVIGRELEEIQAMTLEWQESDQHPLLFLDADEVAKKQKEIQVQHSDWAALVLSLNSNSKDSQVKRVVKKLSDQLGLLGNYDVMRKAIGVAGMYDALIDSDWISKDERRIMRAQMAYLGYLLADPMCWSSERGYGSGNPNMHCSYILTLGVVACVLRDHPMSEQWANYAADWLDHWLDHEVGPGGEWVPEGSHYGNVSLEAIVSFTIASQRAGYRDFTNDPRLKRLITYFAKLYTPPNPEKGGVRVTANYGRGVSSEKMSTIGIAARMYAQADPELSAKLQWLWAQTNYTSYLGDYRLGGFRYYYVDKTLPQQAPEWHSEQFPDFGVVFRAGFNTPKESFVNFLAGVDSIRNLDIWAPSVTDIAQWYALGKPISTCFTLFTGTKERHELLSEGVQLARNYQPGDKGSPFGYYTSTDFSAFATLPGMDYARTVRTNIKPDERNWLPPHLPQYPKLKKARSDKLTVDRQVAFIREDSAPTTPAYLVVRDTTSGGEPTAWQFWTLSNGITPTGEETSSKLGGEQILPTRPLPDTNRFTAHGQFGVNLEYFVASPNNTPRNTLRYGGNDQIDRKQTQYQDVFHLQRPDDGAYFVALFPKLPDDASPKFDVNDDQHIIHVSHQSGEDYVFLSDKAERSSLDQVSFNGTAGSVKLRKGEQWLALGAPGEAKWEHVSIKADMPVCLRITGKRLYIDTSATSPGGKLSIEVPGKWSRVKAAKGPGNFNNSLELELPAGPNGYIYEQL